MTKRIINFRAKGFKTKDFIYGCYVYMQGCDMGEHLIFDNSLGAFVEIYEETLGQFTGLYDKNKVPIYERRYSKKRNVE